ncbi:MAG: chromosomal replication initiator protein DnaA [Armatimonadota bacterium]
MVEQLLFDDNKINDTLTPAWESALKLLAPEISRPSFESFIRTARILGIENDTVTIGAASELAKIFLEKYTYLIKTSLEPSLGHDLNVTFTIAPPVAQKNRPRETAPAKEQQAQVNRLSSLSMPLNDKYVFSNFIVGPCNRLAQAAAQSVADSPGNVYNPFFLYGGPGLGKTHILQAVGHHITERHPNLKVAYVSGEVFTTHYVTALRDHRSEDFRRKYRSIDVLLIDDVQFLAGKERTKEEFFHTFNALHQMNKQIILCSDRSPRDLNLFEERLRSRFEAGLVVDIAPPDLETRLAILQNKAINEKSDVPMQVLECIANMIPTNIRALEGALVTLMAYSSLMKAAMSVDLAREVLGRYMTDKKYTELTPDIIQRVVAQAFDVSVIDLCGAKRQKELVSARHTAIYLSRELTQCSLPAIGKAFGGRDHSTVIHACQRVASILNEDQAFKETLDSITEDLKTGKY